MNEFLGCGPLVPRKVIVDEEKEGKNNNNKKALEIPFWEHTIMIPCVPYASSTGKCPSKSNRERREVVWYIWI